ncbi:MAG: hypothetical protein L3I99_05020 [Sulfurimonas sp.]|nr:hypothetical protein [Sulfurimonas sp.]
MSEKDEALQRLDDIKSTLADHKFFPYNYNALIVWGIISIVLSLFLLEIFQNNLLYGTLFLITMLIVGFFTEGFLMKKENINYDITECTKKQKFIFRCYLLTSLFGITMSVLLVSHNLLIPIYMLWIFICGIGNFVVGFIINRGEFIKAGYGSIVLSIILMGIASFVPDLGSLDTVFERVVQSATIFSLGVIPIYLGVMIKKQMKLV